jgi:hypothetical protein
MVFNEICVKLELGLHSELTGIEMEFIPTLVSTPVFPLMTAYCVTECCPVH